MRNHSLPKRFQSKAIEISLGLICTFLIVITQAFKLPVVFPLINQLDYHIYDQLLNLNLRPHITNPNVIIIDIDEKSVTNEGRWPWPRDKMAALITKLKQYGVVTIGLDIVMSEAEINYALGLKDKLKHQINQPNTEQIQLISSLDKIAPQVDNDQAFINVLKDHNVVLGFLFHYDSRIQKGALPPPISDKTGSPLSTQNIPLLRFEGYNGSLEQFIRTSTQAGFVTNLPDRDGTIRHALMLAIHNNSIYPSLALAIAMNYLLINNLSVVVDKSTIQGIQMDGIFIPTNPIGQILVPFWGKAGALDYYSATDILHGKVNAQELQGSIAIIGSSMTLLSDLHQTPIAQLFPGVEIVGNMVQAIVAQQVTKTYDWYTYSGLLYIALFGIFFAFLVPFLGVIGKLLATFVTIAGILAGAVLLLAFKNLYVPSASLLFLITLQVLVNYSFSFISERRQKRKISQLFGQYVPEDYVKELIEFPEQYSMEGQTRNMTVQFTDIRNFTTVSETLDAVGVKHLLNTFFTPITEIIFRHRGTIDKYVGDMIVAFWGAPIEDKDHTYNAIMSSITVFKYLPEINAQMLQQGLPMVNIGIGLASGLMNVGDMGSEFRRAYTVLGDTVNLASRLQDLTKFYQVDILVNDAARSEQDLFVWKPIDKVAVKGRKSALTIYQPVGIVKDAPAELHIELEHYCTALGTYYAQQWSAAEQQFKTLKDSYPDIYLYQMYYERVMVFMKEPPPRDWDGVYIHSHK